MRILLILCLVSFHHSMGFSQKPTNSDELKRITSLLNNRDYDSARVQLIQLKPKYEKNNNALYARFERLNGILFDRIGKLDSAEYHYNIALEVYESIKMSGHVHDMYSQLGVLFDKRGDQIKALKFFQKALEIARDEDNLIWQMKMHVNISISYHQKREFNSAINHAEKAWKIAYKEHLTQYFPQIKNLMGTLLIYEGNYSGALDHFQFLLEEGERVGNQEFIMAGYQNISSCYFKLDKYKESLGFAYKSLDLSFTINDHLTMCSSLSQLGHNYFGLNRLDSAIYYYEKALSIADKYKLGGKRSSSLGDISKTYIAMKQYVKAKGLLTKQRLSIAEGDNENYLGVYYQSMISVLKNEGDDKLVIIYLDSLILHKNKNESTNWSRLERLEFEQDVKQLNREKKELIAGLESENGSLKSSTFVLIGAGVLLFILLIVQIFKKIRMRDKIDSINISHSKEGDKLKNQIDEIRSFKDTVDNTDFFNLFNLLLTRLENKFKDNQQKVQLSNQELQICVLVAFGCPNYKGLWILKMENTETYTSARYRIRKKLKIENDHDLKLFLLRLMSN